MYHKECPKIRKNFNWRGSNYVLDPWILLINRCLVLGGSKVKCYIFATIKFIGEIHIFSNVGSHNDSYLISRFQYSTSSKSVGRQASKRYSVFRQEYTSISVAKLSVSLMSPSRNSLRFFHFFTINNVFSKSPEEKIQWSHTWRMRGTRMGSPFPSTDQEPPPVQKGANTTGEVRWCTT